MKKAVLVTTEFRGVFFGYVEEDEKAPNQITITDARNCIYWQDCGGFLGLAATGPNSSCRIGASIEELTLYKITSITPVSKEAAKAWDKAVVYGAK
jgi:hypothetical protein